MRMRDTIDPNADDDDWAFNVPRTVTLHLALDQNARAFLVREQQIVRPFEGQLRRQRWRFGDHGIAQRQSRNKGEFGRALDGRWIDQREARLEIALGRNPSPAMTPATAGLRQRPEPD